MILQNDIVSLKKIPPGIEKKSRDRYINSPKTFVKFILKKHLKEGYLFNKDVVNSFSEGDYVVKFWAPLIEKIFRNTGTIPHWGDTNPVALRSEGVNMKMDLRLFSILNHKDTKGKNVHIDNGFGEFAHTSSPAKYYKDKRKTVVASKAALNCIIGKNKSVDHKDLRVPYLIVMGFQMHLCYLVLVSPGFYITKKFKTLHFPETIQHIKADTEQLINGLHDLLNMCLLVQDAAKKVRRKRSIDVIIGGTEANLEAGAGKLISKVIWDQDSIHNSETDLESNSEDSSEDESDEDESGDENKSDEDESGDENESDKDESGDEDESDKDEDEN